MADEVKVGGYICTGCGIGERLDAGQMEMIATREGRIASCKQHEFLCSPDGVKMIQDDIDSGDATHIMIAACSRRSKMEAFNFGTTPMSRANLREGVIWIRPEDPEHDETTQEMADDYIRMACNEVKQMHKPESSHEAELNKNILVVGGGITGMTAAIEAAKAGFPTTIVEKSDKLGGVVGGFSKKVPSKAPYAKPEDTGIAEMIAAIEADSNITVHLNSKLAKTSGAPGRFVAEIEGAGVTSEFGAIIQATGFTPYDANNLPELGYGKTPDVITQLELEALVKDAAGSIKRPSDGKEVNSVVFVQCAGQRSTKENHLEYCSGHCCTTSIKQALYFKEANGDIDTTILFDDLRTPGAGGEDFYRAGQEAGVTFRKGKVSEVDGSLNVKFDDLILAEEDTLTPDLVVLATGMIPNSGVNIEAIAIEDDEDTEIDADIIAKIDVESILNLDYRQGPDVPQLVSGFTDSHFICFPYETRRTGIYTAGPVRRPMDVEQAKNDAMGAAMKAIQAAVHAAEGSAVHPRSGDLSFPKFRKEGCTQCKRCTVECPFGAINEDEKGYPQFNEARCRRCGTCMGACPVRVISFENYSIMTVSEQIKNVDIPDEFDEKPRILVLACENDAYPALDMAAATGKIEITPFARVIPVRCLGSVSTIWIQESLDSGYDGVVLMGCKKGADYQCHFVKGSEMAHYRMGKIGDTLETLSLEKERVAVYEIAITDIEYAPKVINDMAATIEEIGMSPFKF